MTRIAITTDFVGDLGELYFKHLCQQRGFGYTRLARIHKAPNPVLEFTFSYARVPVMMPREILEEVNRVSQPTLVNGTQAFVFDFLTCKIYKEDKTDYPNQRHPDDFCWVEIKAGNSKLSRHQYEMAKSCKIRFSLFRVRNVMTSPRKVEIDWAFDSLRAPQADES